MSAVCDVEARHSRPPDLRNPAFAGMLEELRSPVVFRLELGGKGRMTG